MTVLVYHPVLATKYAEMIRAEEPELDIRVATNEDEAAQHVEEAEVLACQVGFPSQLLSRAQELKWIQVMGAGVDKFVLNDVVPEGVALTRVTQSFGGYISEYVVAHLLSITQRLRTFYDNQQQRHWEELFPQLLFEKTVGVAGLGNIGSEVAEKLLALGCTVYGLDVVEPKELDVTWIHADKLHEFLAKPDFVVICLPLTPETKHVIGADEFEAMKETAYLVNVARGGLVDQAALVEALQAGTIEGAVLDVFEEEPLPEDSPLWDLPNVTVTPHISGPADPQDAFETFMENLQRFRRDEALINEVNLERGF